jgi:calcium/calmodulin-dependent protein kinase I
LKIHEIKGKLFLGMELVKDGRLTDIIKERQEKGETFSGKEASALLRGILNAVQYIHENDIVHRDLKPGK